MSDSRANFFIRRNIKVDRIVRGDAGEGKSGPLSSGYTTVGPYAAVLGKYCGKKLRMEHVAQ